MKKQMILIFLAFIALRLSATAVVFTEDFSGDPMSEWVTLGANNGDNWSIFSSNNAGGAIPEARFEYEPRTVGEQELISPDIDTSGFRDLTLSFRYMLDHFTNGEYTIGVKVYDAGGSETVVWSVNPQSDISARMQTVTIDNSLVDTDQFQISFFFSGDSYYLDFWFVDSVILQADTQVLSGTVATDETLFIYADAVVPAGEVWTVNPGAYVLLYDEYNIDVEGEIVAVGTEDNPITFGPYVAGDPTGHIKFESNPGISTFEWCEFSYFNVQSNDPVDGHGGAMLIYDSPGVSLSNCCFENNSTQGKGGALGIWSSENTIENCIFESNSAPAYGGAVSVHASDVNLDHCLFNGNTGQVGGAIYFGYECHVDITNCTLSDNSDATYITDIFVYPYSGNDSYLNIENTVWWNSCDYLVNTIDQGLVYLNVNYCDLQNTPAFAGDNITLVSNNLISVDPIWNFDKEPIWNSYPARDEYRSPLIDAGDPESTPDGDNTVSDIGYAYYDQGPHVMGEVSGLWTVAESPYRIGGPIHVASGETLSIEPGVEVLYNGPWIITVEGAIYANGTDSDRICFAPVVPGIETGNVYLYSNAPGSCSFNACDFSGLHLTPSSVQSCQGAAIEGYMSQSISISNCFFTDNQSDDQGGAIGLNFSSAIISDCSFIGNFANDIGGAIYIMRGDVDIMRCLFADNSSQAGTSVYFGYNTQSSIANCTFADNYTYLYQGDVYLYTMPSFQMNLSVTNTVWWDCTNAFIRSSGSGNSNIDVRYCDLENPSGFSGTNMSLTTSNIISENPLWDEEYIPTWASCPDDDETKSPLIDAGDPNVTDDDDTVVDIGYAYYDQGVPVIAHVHDIPGDQGHQVQVLWKASSHDSMYDFSAFYSLWREDDVVRSNAVFDSAEELMAAVRTSSQTMYLRYDDTYWAFIASIPATTSEFYIYNAPTIADSSTSGTNDATFMVMHHRMEGLWQSETASGHSVDNIAPDQVMLVTIDRNASMMEIDWSAVTTGSYEGNSYPELNGVWYKVYAGTTPDFECNDTTYICTTQTPSTHVEHGAQQMMFYKIIASDQP